ncbi:MAG: hypothetical protein CMP20_10450 [Rickettsiales bacterium]|nr:hypothetical protein [Rickettsiales bacterium]
MLHVMAVVVVRVYAPGPTLSTKRPRGTTKTYETRGMLRLETRRIVVAGAHRWSRRELEAWDMSSARNATQYITKSTRHLCKSFYNAPSK